MKKLILVFLLFGTLALAGQMSPRMQCPMSAKDAAIAVADTPTGVAITFTTDGDLKGLRRHVQQMAKMYSQKPDEKGDMMQCCMPAASAVYEAVPNGARLSLKPKDPAQLESFQNEIRQHVESMKSGDCCADREAKYCPRHKSAGAGE